MTFTAIRNWSPGRAGQTLFDLLICLLIFFLAFGAVVYRIDQAPDIFTDEIVYTRVGVRVSGEGAMVWDSGEPFLVHPPLYFLLEVLHFSLSGDPNMPLYGAGDIFSAVTYARHLNAILAGITGVFFYIFGKIAHGRGLGLLLAAIFFLDPFGVRINRRAMLETLAGLLSIAGLTAFLALGEPKAGLRPLRIRKLRDIPISPRVILPGLLLGAALLAKELTFTNLLVVLLFGLWEAGRIMLLRRREGNWSRWADGLPVFLASLATTGLAILTYSLYPLWVRTSGLWPSYSREKILELKRLLGFVHLSGWNRPGVSFLDYLTQRLIDYGSSYLILALGAAAILGLLLWGRKNRSGRLLIAWGLVMYPFFFFVALVGSGNDQFFYFLLIPATILVGYAGMTMADFTEVLLSAKWATKTWYLAICYIYTWASKFVLIGLVLLILPFNIFRWWTVFGVSQDNGYTQFAQYVNTKLPAGVSLNASGDPIKFHYFLPNQPIFARSTPEEAMEAGIHYFALSPKDVQFHYGSIEPVLASWIQENGTPLFSYEGSSYGNIFLYRVDYPNPGQVAQVSDLIANQTHWRSFKPARGGFVDSLVLSFVVWSLAWGVLYVGPRQFYGFRAHWV